MNTRFVIKHGARMSALGAGLALLATVAVAAAADDSQAKADPFLQHIKKLQDDMSQVFRNTWLGVKQDKDAQKFAEPTLATASVDLREQSDSYTVRLNLPNRDVNKVEINLTGNTLRIVAPVEGKEGRYEQNIQLDGVAANAPTQVSRSPKDNLIVVNVPKAAVDTVAATPSVTPAAPLDAWVAWDRDVLAQMDRMQREMDAVVNQAFVDFPTPPRLGGFFNQARFDSSFSVQEQGSNYIVRAYLPARDMGNVNVTVEGQILKIEAKGENTQQGPNGNTALSQKAQYSQVLTLPGPVQSDKMTVDRKENMLIVTLPKAAGPASPSLTQKTVLSAPGQRA